jgi:hypothetical protein
VEERAMTGIVRRWRQQRRAAVLQALNPFAPSTNLETERLVSFDAKNTIFVLTDGVRCTLRRFEREGLVKSFVVARETGLRTTRYYELTERGIAARDALLFAARATAHRRRPR